MNEEEFLLAVDKYNRRPSKKRAIQIYETYLDPQAPKKISVRISYSAMEDIRLSIINYRQTREERQEHYRPQKYNPLSMLKQRVKRHSTARTYRAEGGIFDEIAEEVIPQMRLEDMHRMILDIRYLKVNLEEEKERYREKARRKLERLDLNLSVNEAMQYMQASDLTINFDPASFFRGQRETIKNMWQISDIEHGTDWYQRKRDISEKRIFPPLLREEALVPTTRPVYAALNIGRKMAGGAMMYGQSYFVLRDEVKRRCTYTPEDSFKIAVYVITNEAIDKLAIQDVPSEILDELRTSVGRKFHARDFDNRLNEVYRICGTLNLSKERERRR